MGMNLLANQIMQIKINNSLFHFDWKDVSWDTINTNWSNQYIEWVDFIWANFSWSYFETTRFVNCNFSWANFSETRMDKVRFINCNLTNIDFTKSNIHSCDINDSDISYSDFSNSDIWWVWFSNTKTTKPIFNKVNIGNIHWVSWLDWCEWITWVKTYNLPTWTKVLYKERVVLYRVKHPIDNPNESLFVEESLFGKYANTNGSYFELPDTWRRFLCDNDYDIL